MNTLFVKSAPPGDFAEVSALQIDWLSKFQVLVSQHQPIKFDFYPLPNLPQEIKRHLETAGYRDFILENDQWQHYLLPKPSSAGAQTQLAAGA